MKLEASRSAQPETTQVCFIPALSIVLNMLLLPDERLHPRLDCVQIKTKGIRAVSIVPNVPSCPPAQHDE